MLYHISQVYNPTILRPTSPLKQRHSCMTKEYLSSLEPDAMPPRTVGGPLCLRIADGYRLTPYSIPSPLLISDSAYFAKCGWHGPSFRQFCSPGSTPGYRTEYILLATSPYWQIRRLPVEPPVWLKTAAFQAEMLRCLVAQPVSVWTSGTPGIMKLMSLLSRYTWHLKPPRLSGFQPTGRRNPSIDKNHKSSGRTGRHVVGSVIS